MADIPLRILMSVAGGSALSGALGSLASSLGPAGIVGAALVGFGVSSVKASSDFQTAMLQNQAHAGLAASQVQTVNQALLAMGPAVGQGPTQLAQALYPILSGFSGITNQAAKTQVSLTELKLAAESVAGTTTSVTTVSNAATAAFNALGLQTNNTALATERMNHLFDVMSTTVSAGNMRWSDYAAVAGKLATSLKGTTVSFNEANAALATMTNEGYSAHLSQTYLSNLFTELDLKTDSMAKNAQKLGISFDEQKFKSMSLAQQIQYLTQITHGNQSEVLKLLNGNATALRTYNALSSGMSQYQNNLTALNHSQGATATAFQVASSGFNFSLQRLQASFQSLQISLGTIFLPILTVVVNAIVPVVSGLASWVAENDQVTDRIMNASTGLLPTLRHLRDMAMELSQVLSYWLIHATGPLRQEFALTAAVAREQFTPALQQTATWMQSTGEPVYRSFSRLAHDVLSGSFHQASIDAMKMSLTIEQSLQELPAKLKSINLSQVLKIGGTVAASPLLLALGVPNFLPNLIQGLQPALNWLKTTFGPAFSAIFGPIGATFNQVMTDLGPQVQQFLEWLSNMFDVWFGGKGQGNTKQMGGLLNNLGDIWKKLWQIIGQVVEIVVKLGIYFLEFILPFLVPFMQFIGWLIVNIGGPLVGAIDNFLQGLLNLLTWINTTAAPAIGNFFTGIQTFFFNVGTWSQKGVEIVLDWLGHVLDWFKSFPGKAMDFIEQFANTMGNRFKSLWHQLINDAKAILGGIGDAITGIFKSAVNMLIGQINNFINGLDQIHISLPGGGSIGFSIPDIPYLASGGIVTSAGLVGMNERGAEVVALPTGAAVYPHGTVPAPSGPTYYIIVNLSTMARSQAEMRNVVDLFEQELGRRVRLQTPSWAAGGLF